MKIKLEYSDAINLVKAAKGTLADIEAAINAAETEPVTMFVTQTNAQWFNDVLLLKKHPISGDSGPLARTSGGPIIFISNSRGVQWGSFYTDFGGLPMINRSYGGAPYQSHALYARDLTHTDIKPRQIIIKGGENEIAVPTNATTPYWPNQWFTAGVNTPLRYDINKPWIEFLFYNFKNTLDALRQFNPDARLTYATMDLSPKFVNLGQTADIQAINTICKEILSTYGNTSVIELENVLVPADYQTDMLHWKSTAYGKATPIVRTAIQ